MADVIPFDQVFDDVSPQASAPTVIPFDQVENDIPESDFGAIRNSAVKGLGATLGLADLVVGGPLRYMGLKTPSFQGDYTKLATDAGLLAPATPATGVGRLAENVAENATAAAPFGPLAMAINGVLGGSGGFIGESVAGPTGRTVGSFLGGVSPTANKIPVVKALTTEIGEAIGPTLSQLFPKVIGSKPLEAAVGRAIGKQATDLSAVEAALAERNALIGPRTETDSLKTVDEITGDVGVAQTTDAVENAGIGAGFKQVGEQRADAQARNIFSTEKAYSPDTTDYELSKRLENGISKGVDDFEKNVETPLWDDLNKQEQVLADESIDSDFLSDLSEITYEGVVPLEGKAKGLVSLVEKARAANNGVLSIGQIQALRSRALKVGRAAKNDTTETGQMTRDTAEAVEKHLRNIVDVNSDTGLLSEELAKKWATARQATNLKFTKLSAQKEGTKNLEKLALKGEDLDNATLLKEGLSSPDKMESHLAAALLGGADNLASVRSQYRQGLLATLEGKKPGTWDKTISDNKQLWQKVFSEKELSKIKSNTDDARDFIANEGRRVTTGSGTNLRGNVQKQVFSEKGIAGIGSGATNAATLIAAGAGAQQGWNSAETIPGGIVRGIIGGFIGAAGGKALKGATARASASFDNLLVEALKDPRTAERVIQATKPSDLGKLLSKAVTSTAYTSAGKAGTSSLNSIAKSVLQKPTAAAPTSDTQTETEAMPINRKVSEFEGGQRLDAYPPPLKGSGVTVGTGIDLGGKTVKQLTDLGLDEKLVKKLTPYLGLKDADAKKILKEKPLTLKQEEADQLDEVIGNDIGVKVGSLYTDATGKSLADLPEEAQTVIASLAHNFGPNLDKALPTIWKDMVAGDWESMKKNLETMKWKQPELKKRRMAEASILGDLISRVV